MPDMDLPDIELTESIEGRAIMPPEASPEFVERLNQLEERYRQLKAREDSEAGLIEANHNPRIGNPLHTFTDEQLLLHDTQVGAKVLEPVLEFINQRPEYVNALRHSGGAHADYHRWSGGAEARRQLANLLGLTVPHELGDRAEPREAGESS